MKDRQKLHVEFEVVELSLGELLDLVSLLFLGRWRLGFG